MSKREPTRQLALDHVVRAASLPWRPPDDWLTECGLPVAEHRTITREELLKRVRDWGQSRTALTTCMTCWQVGSRYRPWAEDPFDAIRREVYGRRGQDDQFRQELRAIAALIEAHREEFDAYMAGLGETVDLAAQRRARQARRSR